MAVRKRIGLDGKIGLFCFAVKAVLMFSYDQKEDDIIVFFLGGKRVPGIFVDDEKEDGS